MAPCPQAIVRPVNGAPLTPADATFSFGADVRLTPDSQGAVAPWSLGEALRAVPGVTAALAAAADDAGAVCHLAAIPSVGRSVAEPLLTHAANLTGTLAVLEACLAFART